MVARPLICIGLAPFFSGNHLVPGVPQPRPQDRRRDTGMKVDFPRKNGHLRGRANLKCCMVAWPLGSAKPTTYSTNSQNASMKFRLIPPSIVTPIYFLHFPFRHFTNKPTSKSSYIYWFHVVLNKSSIILTNIKVIR